MRNYIYKFRCIKYLLLWVVICSSSALAQIEIGLRVEPKKALLHEAITAYVEIDNNTTEAVSIGGNQSNAEMDFVIRDMNGNYVSKRSEGLGMTKTVTVEPFKSETIAIDIVSYYNIVEPRPYKIACDIKWRGQIYESRQSYFDVVPGILIASKVVQLPGDNDIVRKFSLFYLHRENRAQLFMRIENIEKSICYGVYNFGDYIRIQDAEMEVDNRGRIHLLYQSGPRRFSYYILNTHGKTVESKFYAGTASKIDLVRTNAGEVFVDGGQEYEGDTYSAPYEFETNRIFE